MGETPEHNLEMAQALISRVLTPSVLTIIGQEFATAYLTCHDLENSYLHPSTCRETSPPLLRGLIETALVNIAQNIGGAEIRPTPNAGNTSTHNELILAGQIVLSAARCHPWTLKPATVDFRRAGSVRNGDFFFPEMLEVPNVTNGSFLHGYFEHLPGVSHRAKPQIMRVHFPSPDFMGEIATTDLKPYFLAAVSRDKIAVTEIEEAHDLSVLEEQKTN